MAFSVAPTSGGAPYVLSALFISKSLIDGVDYSLHIMFSTSSGSCPTQGSSTPLNQTLVNTLLVEGSVSTSNVVPLGSCRAYTISIVRMSDSVVVSSSTAFVDNV